MRSKALDRLPLIISSLVLLVGSAGALNAADTMRVDPVHSMVIFRAKHFGVGHIYGRFNEISGTFTIDDENPAASSFQIEVKAGSVDTNQPKRDQHLKSPDFLNAKQFPAISFKSNQVKKIDEQTFEVTGELTLHGATQPVTAKVERLGVSQGGLGGKRMGLETTFTLKRSEFGMKFMIPAVSDEIRITVAVEGVP